jgi:hypothetical protein
MADRFPLIVDISDGNKIKELPSGDNLNLENSGIVKADSIQTGAVNTVALQVDGKTLDDVAFSGNFNDLINVPPGFSGSWDDLTDIPVQLRKNNLPLTSRKLGDISDDAPSDKQTLVYNSLSGEYEPKDISDQFDLTNYSIGDLDNVVITGNTTNKYLKFSNGAWQPSFITWGEVVNRPQKNSRFDNDSGYLNPTSLDAYISTDSTITYQNGAISVTDNSITSTQLDVADTGEVGDSLHSTGEGDFVWRNPYVEQASEPDNPLPGDEWLETDNNIYYKYLGGHWIPIVQYDVIETEDGVEINTESGDAIDFGDSTG